MSHAGHKEERSRAGRKRSRAESRRKGETKKSGGTGVTGVTGIAVPAWSRLGSILELSRCHVGAISGLFGNIFCPRKVIRSKVPV